MLWKLIFQLIILFVQIFNIKCNNSNSYDTFTCCSEVYGSCRTSCDSLSLVQIATETGGKEAIQDIKRLCHLSQTDFWKCMNKTLQAVARGAQWSGRPCCSLASSLRCQNSCATASKREDLSRGCRQSDEQNFYSCVDKQEMGDECCGNARTSDCLTACKEIFRTRRTPSQTQITLALKACNDSNPSIIQCIKNFTDVTPNVNLRQYLPCCSRSSDYNCTTTCQRVLSSVQTTPEAIDEMELGGCGTIQLHDPLWQCLISTGKKPKMPPNSNEVSRINQIGMDSAKLHCCQKAVAPKCRRLCTLTFSNDWTETRGDFEFDCLTQINEITLKQCIDEVDEPCELGCDGLSFCTNFNNRPTELFRSCNTQADLAAQSDIALWQSQGFLRLPGIDLPVKNISQCSPKMWKAVACTLQIKPCTKGTHANLICREDCFEILSKCMDWTQLSSGHTASSLCKKLSMDDTTTPCISLKPFLEESDTPRGNFHISSPCRGNPCNATQVCQVNRGGSTKYTCPAGCPLGEASQYLVPIGSYVRISSNQKDCKDCHKVCRCGVSGRIEKCQPLPSFTYDSCNLAGKRVDHASWFYVECNICSCFAGEITCTKKQCRIQGISDKSYTSLPCNCPTHHVPVCGRNGNTYPSDCVAKCTGLQDAEYEFGPCRSRDPCKSSNCNSQSKCVSDWQICLTGMQKPCQQFQCVNTTGGCNSLAHPACDTEGRTHSSLCHLVKAKAKLAYTGRCMTNCQGDSEGPVCGINGITYKSECEAWSDFSLVDYQGVCREIGLLTDIFGPHCNSVKCKPLPSTHCVGIVPPGACCPICSGALRIVYSRKQIDRVLYALNGQDTDSVSLKSALRAMENLIQVAQCRLSGYLTVETDLFVAIQSTAKEPNEIMIEICTKEAEKIATLIATQSHRVTSDLSLSALTVANIVQPSVISNATKHFNQYWITAIILFCQLIKTWR